MKSEVDEGAIRSLFQKVLMTLTYERWPLLHFFFPEWTGVLLVRRLGPVGAGESASKTLGVMRVWIKCVIPSLFLFIFVFSSNKHYTLHIKSMCLNVHTGNQTHRPSDHETPPITTRWAPALMWVLLLVLYFGFVVYASVQVGTRQVPTYKLSRSYYNLSLRVKNQINLKYYKKRLTMMIKLGAVWPDWAIF